MGFLTTTLESNKKYKSTDFELNKNMKTTRIKRAVVEKDGGGLYIVGSVAILTPIFSNENLKQKELCFFDLFFRP